MTANCQQSLRQFGGMKYWRLEQSRLDRHMLRNYQERESTEQRCHRWWLVTGTGLLVMAETGRPTEIIQTYRLQLMSQSQTDPPRHRTTTQIITIHHHTISPATQVLVQFLANYSN